MKTPVPGLRPIHNRSNQPAKVQVVIAPDDTLHVSEDLAGQLERATTALRDPEWTPTPKVTEALPEPAAEEEPAKPVKKAAAKRTAKRG